MKLFNYVYKIALAKAEENGKEDAVIGVAGAGCIGKTTFCHKFRDFAGHSECQLISMDGYMLERKRRDKLGDITGYNPSGFELAKAEAEISSLIHFKKSFFLYKYDRRKHRRDKPELVKYKKFILIEGGLSLSGVFYELEDLHVFIDSDMKTQYMLRSQREQTEFGYTPTQIKNRFKRYHKDYEKFIQPQIELADLVLKVDQCYNFYIVRGPICESF